MPCFRKNTRTGVRTSRILPQNELRFRRWLLWMTVILLIGAGLRIHAFAVDRRFHSDEALFASIARHAELGGEWMFPTELDKPPLALYLQAFSMALTGAQTNTAGVLDQTYRQGELAARLPALISGILQIALAGTLARRLFQKATVGLFAAFLMALSPLAIGFSATAFTDMPMLTFGMAGLYAVVIGRWGWAGLWMALAFASKPQGAIFIPLALLIGASVNRFTARQLLALCLPVIVAFGLITLWDAARGLPDSLWALALVHNTPGTIEELSFGGQVLSELAYLPALFGAPTIIFIILIPFSIVVPIIGGRRDQIISLCLSLAFFTLIMLLVQAALQIPHYDRYLLPLLPPLLLLSAYAGLWGLGWLELMISKAEARVAAAVMVLAMLVSASEAAGFKFGYADVNTSFPDNSGIEVVAAHLNDQHTAAVVYDHWMNWLLGYYMGEWSNKRRVYYPDPESLVQDALALAECEPRYLPMPADQNPLAWINALEDAGFSIEVDFRPAQWVVYALTPPAEGVCTEAASPDS